jgi:multicomponent Na+:H+ antiporter subunit E
METQGGKTQDREGSSANAGKGIISTDPTPGGRLSAGPFILTFIIMFGVWVLLSGKFDAFHLTLGIICCALVAYLSSDLLFASSSMTGLLRRWILFVRYIPWLMIEIVKANIHLTYLVFHPRMMDLIDPRIVKFRSRLKGDMAMVAFANSITLTPGTITVYVSIDGDFKVHAIDESSGDALPGEMEVRLAMTFGGV